MFKSFRVLKSYYNLSNLKWYMILIEFVILLIPSLLSIASPVLAANVISSITVYDFSNAIYMLSLDFAIIIVTAILYFIYHFVSSRSSKKILIQTCDYVYENIKENQNLNKIKSSTMTDIWTFSKFNNNLLYKFCFLIKSIIILGIIIFYDAIIGVCLIAVSLVSVLLFSITNKQIQKNNLKLTETKSKSLELFNSIQKGVGLENNTFMESTMKYKYFDVMEDCVKTNNKISLFYNLNNNFIALILKIAVYFFTFYLITLVKSTTLTLSLYLFLTPYLTSSAQNLIAFFEVFPEIGTIENILNEFKTLRTIDTVEDEKPEIDKFENFNLQFFHTSIKLINHSIIDVNLEIPYKSVYQFVGNQNSGKRAICILLSKKNPADSGSVFLGNKNINDIPDSQYNKFVCTTYKNPYFYNISILENLSVVCDNKNKITRALHEFGLNEMINELPDKVNTIVDENISEKLLYYLGIVRAYLSNSKIICIYETPDNFSQSDSTKLSSIIKILNEKSTVILFIHKKLNIEAKTILVEDSRIKKAKSD